MSASSLAEQVEQSLTMSVPKRGREKVKKERASDRLIRWSRFHREMATEGSGGNVIEKVLHAEIRPGCGIKRFGVPISRYTPPPPRSSLSLSLLLPRSPRLCLVARGRSIWSQFPLPSVSRLTALSLFRLETKFDAWPDRTGEI